MTAVHLPIDLLTNELLRVHIFRCVALTLDPRVLYDYL